MMEIRKQVMGVHRHVTLNHHYSLLNHDSVVHNHILQFNQVNIYQYGGNQRLEQV